MFGSIDQYPLSWLCPKDPEIPRDLQTIKPFLYQQILYLPLGIGNGEDLMHDVKQDNIDRYQIFSVNFMPHFLLFKDSNWMDKKATNQNAL